MRRVALRTTFNLDEVTKVRRGLVIYGHYSEVKVVVNYQHLSNYDFAQVVLRFGSISTTSYFGKCHKKVLVDVLHTVRKTSEGRLYLLRENYLRRFVVTIGRWMEEWNDKESRPA